MDIPGADELMKKVKEIQDLARDQREPDERISLSERIDHVMKYASDLSEEIGDLKDRVIVLERKYREDS